MRIFFPLKIICIINILVAVLTSVYNNCYYHYHFLKSFEHLSFQSQLIVIPRRENILQSFVICIQTRCVHTHPHVCVCVCVCVCVEIISLAHYFFMSVIIHLSLTSQNWRQIPWRRAPLVAEMFKHLPAMQETQVWSLGWEDPLEKGMATLPTIPAGRSPWTEKCYSPWSHKQSDVT